MQQLYRFSKPGFRSRQSAKLRGAGLRRAFLIDCNLLNDAKISALNREGDHTLLPLLLHIWGQLDLASECWEERTDIFDVWCRGVFGMTNRFDVQKRLQKLNTLGLIKVEVIPQLGVSCSSVNPQLVVTYGTSNQQLPPLEQPQTQSGTEANTPLNNTTQATQTKPETSSAEPSKNSLNLPAQNTDKIWGVGLNLLIGTGCGESSARGFLGRLAKQHGEEALQAAIDATVAAAPADPKGYLAGILRNKQKPQGKAFARGDKWADHEAWKSAAACWRDNQCAGCFENVKDYLEG